MTHLEKFGAVTGLAVVLAAALVWLTFAIGRRRTGCTCWPFDCTCRDDWQDDLPGSDSLPAPRAGEYDEWDDGWQREPWTDDDADQLIAEWRDEHRPIHPEHFGQPPTFSSPPVALGRYPVWDAWWAGLDELERECMLVHDLVVREAREWAEIKAETREMCAA